MVYIPRYIENTLNRLIKSFKVVYLGGPRQVGKTTLLLHLAKKRHVTYVSLDDIQLRELAQRDPELFISQYSLPLFIDEVQYAPQLFPVIKTIVDKSEKTGQFWLTGSQRFSLIKNIQETLSGRVGILDLLGFSLGEIKRWKMKKEAFYPERTFNNHTFTLQDLWKTIFRGSFPVLWQKKDTLLNLFFSSYIQTYLDRDLQNIFGVSKIGQFHTFLRLCAARTGQILNYSELARDAGISVQTAREWISILEQAYLVYLLQPHYNNFSKRIIKSPKLYFLDTGLAAYLTRWFSPETLSNGAMNGAFFETWVVSEIVKSYIFRGQEAPLYYFRDKEGHEIDLLIERSQKIYPIEIKHSLRITNFDLKNIEYFKKRQKNAGLAAIITPSSKEYFIAKSIKIIPAYSLG